MSLLLRHPKHPLFTYSILPPFREKEEECFRAQASGRKFPPKYIPGRKGA